MDSGLHPLWSGYADFAAEVAVPAVLQRCSRGSRQHAANAGSPAGPEDRLLNKCRHAMTERAPMTQGHGRVRAALAHVLPAIALMTAFLAGPASMLIGT